jgi:hypothetical protein
LCAQLELPAAPRNHRAMAMRTGLILLLAAAALSACSWFHHPTPQQQLFDALNRGNGIEASRLWLTMSQKDRIKFNRGEGIKPAVPPQQVVKTLTEMSPDDMQGQITIKPPAAEAGLLELPRLAAPQGAGAPHSNASQTPQQPEDELQP